MNIPFLTPYLASRAALARKAAEDKAARDRAYAAKLHSEMLDRLSGIDECLKEAGLRRIRGVNFLTSWRYQTYIQTSTGAICAVEFTRAGTIEFYNLPTK